MSRIHSRQDIYIDGDLAWSEATLIEQHRENRLKIRARPPGAGKMAKANVLILTETTYVGKNEQARKWTGKNEDGVEVELVAVPRVPSGCSSCRG